MDEPSDAKASESSPSDSSPSDADAPDRASARSERSEPRSRELETDRASARSERSEPRSRELETDARQRRGIPLWAKICLIVGIVFMTVSTSTLVLIRLAIYRLDQAVAKDDLLHSGARATPAPNRPLVGPLNYLLVGSDYRSRTPGDGQRSDTIIVVHVPSGLDRAYLVSIPRDLLVEIPPFPLTEFEGAEAKINSAFHYGGGGIGGIQLLSATLSKLLGIQFDGAAIINFDGFRRAVDVLGGITLCVDREVQARHLAYDSAGKLITVHTDADGNPFVPPGAKLVVYQPGCQHMTGEFALEWTRLRYGLPAGDYDRQRHQQEFLRAMFAEAERQGVFTNPIRLDSFMQAIGSSLTVDTNDRPTEELLFGLRNIRPSTLMGVQVPSHPDNIGGISYILPENDAASLYHAIRDDTVEAWVAAHPDWVNEL